MSRLPMVDVRLGENSRTSTVSVPRPDARHRAFNVIDASIRSGETIPAGARLDGTYNEPVIVTKVIGFDSAQLLDFDRRF